MASYRFVENPIRHWKLPSRTTVAAGIATVLATVAILSLVIGLESSPQVASGIPPAPNLGAVLREVAAAKSITQVPATVEPALGQAASDWGGAHEGDSCSANLTQSTESLCILGDVHARRLLIVYGDSHALMWLPAFEAIADHAHMRLLVLGKSNCPASLVTIVDPAGIGAAGAPYVACNTWHKWAMKTINRLSPNILVISQDSTYVAPGFKPFTNSQWHNGLTKLFRAIPSSRIEKIFLGNIPLLSQSGPTCLSVHSNDPQACSTPVAEAYRRFDQSEFSVTQSLNIRYIDPTPWFCSSVCTAIVGPFDVYMDRFHVTATYATYLQNVLAQALFSPTPTPTHFKENISTKVGRPSDGATISGRYFLSAGATLGNAPVVKVEFRLSGDGFHNALICSGIQSPVGWLCGWNTSQVPNGRYTLHSVAYDAGGESVRSKSVSFSVKN